MLAEPGGAAGGVEALAVEHPGGGEVEVRLALGEAQLIGEAAPAHQLAHVQHALGDDAAAAQRVLQRLRVPGRRPRGERGLSLRAAAAVRVRGAERGGQRAEVRGGAAGDGAGGDGVVRFYDAEQRGVADAGEVSELGELRIKN